MTAAAIIHALGGRRGRCQCPCCASAGRDTGRDHLSVSERNGRLLVHCHAGCPQSDVVAALRERGLWPDLDRPQRTAEERRRWAHAQRQGEIIGQRVWWWWFAKCDDLERTKRDAVDHEAGTFDPFKLEAAAKQLRELQDDSDAVVMTWHRELQEHPEIVRAMEAWGRRLDEATKVFTRAVVNRLAADSEVANVA